MDRVSLQIFLSAKVSFHVPDELGSWMAVWYEDSFKGIKVFITILPAVLTVEPFALYREVLVTFSVHCLSDHFNQLFIIWIT